MSGGANVLVGANVLGGNKVLVRANVLGRVAKCHRYGRYICVKILEGWGKTCEGDPQFCKMK